MTMTSSTLERALPDLAAWTEHLRDADIPILAHTAVVLEALRADEDRADANGLGELIATDPLMTLKVLARASGRRNPRAVTEVETVTGTIVMMGIAPFFREFGVQTVIENHLAERPAALAGLKQVLRRAHRTANFALGFAAHRMDPDAPVIHAAALLHDFAEMLVWCHAPDLALQIAAAQRADPSLRSSLAQREVLHVELADLQQSLVKAWRLPELLVRISDDRHANRDDVRNVVLASRLARHTAVGWEDPAISDDIADIAELLNLSPAATHDLAQSI